MRLLCASLPTYPAHPIDPCRPWHTPRSSDDRSAGTVTNRIKNALDAGSALGSKKPTLVVIDEIDGATGGGDQSFIKSLLKLIQDTPARKRGANDKAEPARFLKRPIICICNDLCVSPLGSRSLALG